MSKIIFTKEEIKKLKKNKNVLTVSERSITYTYEFKILFIEEYISGKLPRDIFAENGFDINIIGYKRIQQAAYKKDGIIGLEDTRIEREQRDLEARDLILKAFNRRGYKKGSRSIKMILENEFKVIYSLKRIRRIMRKYNIVCPHKKANPYKRIAKATKEHVVVKNILNREFKQATPGKVLLTDITYLPYGTSKTAYLSTIKDASTNEILAYKVSDKITLDIALDTIKKLVKTRRIKLTKGAFIHSDQGVHYTSPNFRN